MTPGSLRLVGYRGFRDRVVHVFPKEEIGQEDAFYGTYDNLEYAGYVVHAYEMTEKGWTEF